MTRLLATNRFAVRGRIIKELTATEEGADELGVPPITMDATDMAEGSDAADEGALGDASVI